MTDVPEKKRKEKISWAPWRAMYHHNYHKAARRRNMSRGFWFINGTIYVFVGETRTAVAPSRYFRYA